MHGSARNLLFFFYNPRQGIAIYSAINGEEQSCKDLQLNTTLRKENVELRCHLFAPERVHFLVPCIWESPNIHKMIRFEKNKNKKKRKKEKKTTLPSAQSVTDRKRLFSIPERESENGISLIVLSERYIIRGHSQHYSENIHVWPYSEFVYIEQPSNLMDKYTTLPQ